MNILFRKNMQSQASKERYSKPRPRGKTGMGGKRTGDYGYSSVDAHTFRTHIFLNPSNLPQEYEDEVPSSLTAKRPSVTLMKWATGGAKRKPSGGKSDYPLNQSDTPSRQVSHIVHRVGVCWHQILKFECCVHIYKPLRPLYIWCTRYNHTFCYFC